MSTCNRSNQKTNWQREEKKCERKNGKVGKHAHTADISNVLSGQRAESGICYMMPWLRCLGQFPTDAEHTFTKSAIAWCNHFCHSAHNQWEWVRSWRSISDYQSTRMWTPRGTGGHWNKETAANSQQQWQFRKPGSWNQAAQMCNHAVITQLTEALAHAIVARLGGFLHSSPETGAVENSLVDKVIHSLPCDDTGRSSSSAKEDSAEDSEWEWEWGWAGPDPEEDRPGIYTVGWFR